MSIVRPKNEYPKDWKICPKCKIRHIPNTWNLCPLCNDIDRT